MESLKRFLKEFPLIMDFAFWTAWIVLKVLSFLIPIKKKTIIFVSLGGRNYDDSPRDIYEYIRSKNYFSDWTFIWAFINPDRYDIPGAKVIKFGTFSYLRTLLSCQVWITNGGIDKGVDFSRKGCIIVNTWHGTPIKKIQGEENANQVLKLYRQNKPIDKNTIRCCQSDYDKAILSRVFRADKDCFVMSGLPRNDKLLEYTPKDIDKAKIKLGIPLSKKVILYMPTYREYLINADNEIYLKPPINLKKWEDSLSNEYVLLVRAHYAVSASLGIKEGSFAKDVSKYAPLSDLYAMADILISDYSSAFFDYSIYGRPLRCFAYDYERYEKERGFYMDMEKELPCPIHKNEDELIDSIRCIDYKADCTATKAFAKKYIPNEGAARKTVVDLLIKKLEEQNN